MDKLLKPLPVNMRNDYRIKQIHDNNLILSVVSIIYSFVSFIYTVEYFVETDFIEDKMIILAYRSVFIFAIILGYYIFLFSDFF